jgi:hypothetical protein
MRDIIHFSEPRNKNQFRINYPYYGLFGTADVTEIINNSETVFRCRLLNGTVLMIKKIITTAKWVDINLNRETPLSLVLGNSIDDFLKTN